MEMPVARLVQVKDKSSWKCIPLELGPQSPVRGTELQRLAALLEVWTKLPGNSCNWAPSTITGSAGWWQTARDSGSACTEMLFLQGCLVVQMLWVGVGVCV